VVNRSRKLHSNLTRHGRVCADLGAEINQKILHYASLTPFPAK
jgi:hypothetical protein